MISPRFSDETNELLALHETYHKRGNAFRTSSTLKEEEGEGVQPPNPEPIRQLIDNYPYFPEDLFRETEALVERVRRLEAADDHAEERCVLSLEENDDDEGEDWFTYDFDSSLCHRPRNLFPPRGSTSSTAYGFNNTTTTSSRNDSSESSSSAFIPPNPEPNTYRSYNAYRPNIINTLTNTNLSDNQPTHNSILHERGQDTQGTFIGSRLLNLKDSKKKRSRRKYDFDKILDEVAAIPIGFQVVSCLFSLLYLHIYGFVLGASILIALVFSFWDGSQSVRLLGAISAVAYSICLFLFTSQPVGGFTLFSTDQRVRAVHLSFAYILVISALLDGVRLIRARRYHYRKEEIEIVAL